ncbi:MAG: hypothetical protein RSF00_05535, partial [Oscillospiraceae bacterium]
RSRATAPTEWGEYGKIAIYRRDCKTQPSCKTPRAEQSRRPYGVGRIRQDCNILQRLQSAVRLHFKAKARRNKFAFVAAHF